MDRYIFLASQPWLHELGETATQDTGEGIDESEEWLTAALGYEFKVEKLFCGVCCLHLPLPQGLVVTPTSHCLFFEEGDRRLDPAQLRLQFWVIRHLLHRTTTVCAVFDGKPLQLDHTQCELLQTFGRGEVNGRPTPAFIRMSFGAVALQLWHPPTLSDCSGPSGDKAATPAAAGTAADGQLSAATPAVAGSGSEGDDVQRLEEVGHRLKEAVSNKPFVPRRLPLTSTAGGAAAAAPGLSSGGMSPVDAAHARLAAAEKRRVALLGALQSLTDCEEGSKQSGMGVVPVSESVEQEELRWGHAVLGVSDALKGYCDTRLTSLDVAASLSDMAELQAARQRQLLGSHAPPQWPGLEDGDEAEHADAALWRKEEETKLLLQLSHGATRANTYATC